MALKVIGAGHGRTGTLSLKLALEMLGFGPCDHMIELIVDPSRVGHWVDAWKGRSTDWDAIFDGYRSAVDFPVFEFYAALAEKYPEAKVVLTVRDPEKWWQSAYDTIYRAEPGLGAKLALAGRAVFDERARQIIRLFGNVGRLWDGIFEGRFEDKAFAIGKFEEHIAEVKATIPPERLLVMRVADGWGPLCAFLGVPAPDVPFPRSNSRQKWHARLKQGVMNFEVERAEPLPGYLPQ